MAEGYVIGVDLGGTKLLAGAVDADLSVIHRTNRLVYGLSQDELVQMIVDAMEEIRTAVGGTVEAIGFGIPCTFDSRTGMAVQAVNVPLKDIAFADVVAERLGLPVVVDNDANCHTVCESRIGIAQGATEVALLTLGTGIGGGLLLRGEIYRGWINGGAEMGHMVVEMNGRPCQGNCPNWGCLESVASGLRAGARGVAGRRAAARHRARARARGGPRADRPADHRAGHRRRPGRARRDRDDRPRAGRRDRQPREHLQPAGRRDRRRRDRGGRAAAGARARGDDGARAGAREGRRARRGRALRARGGDDRRRAARARHGRGRSSPARSKRGRRESGRLVVCPTPIGNLEDVTLRVLAALREADVVACEDTRHTRVLLERYGVSATLVSYHEHNERARAAELVERMLGGEVVALVSDAGMPLVSRPRLPAGAGLRRRGAGGRGAARAVGGADRAGGERAAVGRLALRRLPAAQAGRAARAVFAAPETVVAFESPRRVGASLAVLAELDPDRPVAVCRELTKLHEEIVRGSASELAARYATEDPRGEIVLVVGGAPERVGARPGGGRGRPHAGRVRRPREGRGQGRRRAHRRAGQRALPGGGSRTTRAARSHPSATRLAARPPPR